MAHTYPTSNPNTQFAPLTISLGCVGWLRCFVLDSCAVDSYNYNVIYIYDISIGAESSTAEMAWIGLTGVVG